MFLSQHWVANKLHITPATKVLDIGGSAARFEFGDVTVVDVVEPDWDCRFVPVDICRERLPFAAGEFEVCVCTHTLEDLYNPFLAMDEMQRVAGRGYIETPHRGLEACFSVSANQGAYPGWGHHHWMFETVSRTKLRVISKMWYLLRHDAEKIVNWSGPSMFEFFWFDQFEYEELQLLDAAGDHWDFLVHEHNAFVAKNRGMLITAEELERGELRSPVIAAAARPESARAGAPAP